MSFTVVIPFDDVGDGARSAALDYVRGWHADHHDYPVVVAVNEAGVPWRKGAVVQAGVEQTDSLGLIVHDADVLVSAEQLRHACTAVAAGAAPWAMPHRMVYRLHRRATMRVLAGDRPQLDAPPPALMLERPAHHAPPGGGIVVLSRASYDITAGIDPRFLGWGGEDISWARALDTLAGDGLRGDAPMWHLWHAPQPSRLRGGRGSRDNERLASMYLDAVGNVKQMAEVVRR